MGKKITTEEIKQIIMQVKIKIKERKRIELIFGNRSPDDIETRKEFTCISCGNTYQISMIERCGNRIGIDICQGCYPTYKLAEKQFKCEMCGLIFVKANTDEAAKEEYGIMFGERATEEKGVFYDDCYKIMLKEYPIENFFEDETKER